jgi:uncharacterized protein YneF (UPF0154 family)
MTWTEIIVWAWIVLSCPLGFLGGMFVAAQDKEDDHD